MGRATRERWRKDRETLLRVLREYKTGMLPHFAEGEEGDLDLDPIDQRIASIKRRIADLDAKLADL